MTTASRPAARDAGEVRVAIDADVKQSGGGSAEGAPRLDRYPDPRAGAITYERNAGADAQRCLARLL
ncbi:hypothetical protein [Mycobacterium sp.]|uniref:hypothetical protein n=1 Tax=Mycobacterium sp. TaxID=1785 RepID=UPI003BABCF4F